MTVWLRQSTAVTVPVGPFVDDTDGKTPETALTISQADIRLSKNGGAFAQTNNAAGASHMENGWYGVPLNTTDTGTLGELVVNVNESGALQCWARFMVVPANIWDSYFGADYLQVDLQEWVGSAPAALVSTRVNVSVGAMANSVITDTAINSSGSGKIADAVWDEARSGHVAAGTFGEGVKVESLNTQAKADVNAEVLDVLTVDTFAEPAAVPAATSTLKDKINWLFAKARNKVTETSSQQNLRNDGDSGTIGSATVSDDGSTFTRGKFT